MSTRRAAWSRAIAGIAWLAILAIGFGGGLWALDGSDLLATQPNRLSYKLPYCDQRIRMEPNCIVRVTSPAREMSGVETARDGSKLAIATDLAL